MAGQEVDCWVHLECPGSVHTAVGLAGFAKRFKGDIHQRTENLNVSNNGRGNLTLL